MVRGDMGGRWATYNIKLSCFMFFILVPEFQGCFSLNSEGLALLEFRSRVTSDPLGALLNWDARDKDPCLWSGVHCVDGEVQTLDLNGLHLGGVLAPELGNLSHLKSLVLSKNQFCGVIPEQFGQLASLEVLDLRNNNLSGTIPSEIARIRSLKRLLLSSNKFKGSIPLEIVKLDGITEMQFDMNLTLATAAEVGCVNRKVGHCYRFGKGSLRDGADQPGPSEQHSTKHEHHVADHTRRILVEQSSNIAAYPYNEGISLGDFFSAPSSMGSGSFPAVPKQKNISAPLSGVPTSGPLHPPSNTMSSSGASFGNQPMDKPNPASGSSEHTWKYVVGFSGGGILLFAAAAMLVVVYGRAARDIRPWKSGLSGQLQKAFVTGVPKLNSAELETACEDFSNIINVQDVVTVYKGTLSSGVEIAVASTAVSSIKDWTKYAEVAFRKKIAALSRVNHKNFVNLIGYCEEDEPFVRMMVFEYAPNGSLFEHLHVKELEHLDWSTRMRIIMGIGYCLQHLHSLNPPLVHSCLSTKNIYMTDDYAAKIADVAFWANLVRTSKNSGDIDGEQNELPPLDDVDNDVYSFGVLLLETVTGKLPHSDEYGSLLQWAQEYLNDNSRIGSLIDPSLKSFKHGELEIIGEAIQECTQKDPRKRPTMKEVVSKLREVLDISPESATPRLSPLWWAELEILSSEAA
ncbi:OLC1v1021295C2 [Oldenlandia corymbosa var. corymbosa]|uniref:OLC1v1021295C2 n=1 Tax=Oldenlandia corymbosa var. corymbosa TaxID=529605 RepID=A0AAV1BWU8_OLDCO|nr:OLC1v1021295C2 [Oldenlandia corymbosa var. corymbosa]